MLVFSEFLYFPSACTREYLRKLPPPTPQKRKKNKQKKKPIYYTISWCGCGFRLYPVHRWYIFYDIYTPVYRCSRMCSFCFWLISFFDQPKGINIVRLFIKHAKLHCYFTAKISGAWIIVMPLQPVEGTAIHSQEQHLGFPAKIIDTV